ncbi:MAG: cobyrinate a,c-diamide synthase [Thermoplasmata archaeon]
MRVICIAGTHSSAGKTSVSMALASKFKEMGYTVQPYKIGPDFIDSAYLEKVCGRKCINLDLYMRRAHLKTDFLNTDADIGIIEGVMGLYDGVSGSSDWGSTAHICRLLDIPILLVLDGSASSRSIAAEYLGFREFSKNTNIVGTIVNRIYGENHLKMLRQALGKSLIGYINNIGNYAIQERRLGLLPVFENPEFSISRLVEASDFDMKKIIRIMKNVSTKLKTVKNKGTITLNIAYDRAFNFYYAQNLITLSKYFEIQNFSPISDTEYKPTAIYIGGGFPELFAKELAENQAIKKRLKTDMEDGMPAYAECGGLMYLTRYINLASKYEMIGLMDAYINMENKLKIGYTKISVTKSNILHSAGANINGQVFHYGEIYGAENLKKTYSYRMVSKNGQIEGGYSEYNTLADFNHIFLSDKMARNMYELAVKYSKR